MDEYPEIIKRGPGRPPNSARLAEAQAAEAPRPRAARRPMGVLRQKLAYDARPGFHRHWFNDVGNRIREATDAGYTHVKDREGKNVTNIGGSHPHGGALTMYLMEIPQEWYEEDQAAKQQIVNEKEKSIKAGTLEPLESGYVKTAQITPGIR